MKARRDLLPQLAMRYYKVLAKSVDVVGTLQRDCFDIIRKENGNVIVNIYSYKKGVVDSSKQSYHREFVASETKEIVLYGLDGKDLFS